MVDSTQVGEVRRALATISRDLGVDANTAGRVAIVANEAANNLVKHAQQGQVIATTLVQNGQGLIDLVALDRGPGISDMDRAMRDGYSTAGSPGTGLGAMMRAAALFDVYSQVPAGTTVFTRFGSRPAPSVAEDAFEFGVINTPYSGELICGDAWAVEFQPGRCLVLMADGLGHGTLAREAAGEAMRVFSLNLDRTPVQIIQAIHDALKKTRGAAVMVLEIIPGARAVTAIGVGNISCVVHAAGQRSRTLVNNNGIVGHEMRMLKEFSVPWSQDSTLVMHSDGLSARWSADAYPGLWSRHPSLVAGVLYRDHCRQRDDASVLVIRPRPSQVHP